MLCFRRQAHMEEGIKKPQFDEQVPGRVETGQGPRCLSNPVSEE